MKAVVLVLLVACGGSFDGQGMYRNGQMHALRAKLQQRDARDAPAAILLARTEIDLRVVWDDGSFEAAHAALAKAVPANPTVAAELVQATGEVMFWVKLVDGKGEWPALAAQFDRAIALREAADDRRGVAESTFYRGLIAQFLETPEAAKAYWERARDVRDVRDPLTRSYPIRHLGDHAEQAGDLVLAAKLHREALALREQAGDILRLFNSQLTLATFLCERMRDCEAARPQIEAARKTADALRLPHGAVAVGMLEAALAEWRGDLPARDAAWAKVLRLANAEEAAAVKLLRGAARLRAGDAAGALADARALTSRDGKALVAEAAIAAGDFATAEPALVAAWQQDPTNPSARMQLASVAWQRTGRALPANVSGDGSGALAAAKRDLDIRAELDALLTLGARDTAIQRAREAHLPLPAPR